MNRGEIWLINLDPTIGAEIQKTRPAIIVNDNKLGKLPLKIIIPITDWKDRYLIAPWMVRLTPDDQNKLSKDSSADCFQIRSVAEERFLRNIGVVSSEVLSKIGTALAKVLALDL